MNRYLSFAERTGRWLPLLLLAVAALACRAQSAAGSGTPFDSSQISARLPGKVADVDHEDETQEVRRMRALNVARQKAMVADAEKLLALARDLNAGIGADGAPLSASQRMRMAADIEKLAHSVKEKMSYVAGTPSLMRSPIPAWPQ
jgi:hypothetical protein